MREEFALCFVRWPHMRALAGRRIPRLSPVSTGTFARRPASEIAGGRTFVAIWRALSSYAASQGVVGVCASLVSRLPLSVDPSIQPK